jgi:hypothetical protein
MQKNPKWIVGIIKNKKLKLSLSEDSDDKNHFARNLSMDLIYYKLLHLISRISEKVK